MKEMIFQTVGGLALFLFGMGMLSEGLKKAAGDRLRRILEKMTSRPIFGLMLGAGVTALIQSSSATTVMVVGLANAALFSLKQSICVILGANIGTTMTAWLVGLAAGLAELNISLYAMPILALGLIMQFAGRKQRTKYIGQILLGFGILMVGLGFMGDAFRPLSKNDAVRNFLAVIGDRPILAVLAGAGITVLIQSSSASIGIIQFLAANSLFGGDWEVAFRIAVPFILGDNIGTTITAQLAALRSNVHARRAAMAHTMFNVLGVCWVLPLAWVGLFPKIVSYISPWSLGPKTIGFEIALAHTVFNVINAMAFLPLVGLLAKVVTKITPSRVGEAEIRPVTLERHLLDTPAVAIDQAQKEIVRMASAGRDAVRGATAAIREDDRRRIGQVLETEDTVDAFQAEITRYLVELSQRTLSAEMAYQLPVLLHMVNDLERVSDHAVNITEIATRKIDQREAFSPAGAEEMGRMTDEVEAMFENVLTAIKTADQAAARKALECEDKLNQMQMDFRHSHVQRLSERTCSPIAGMIFVDFVDNMEKIGDHLTNIAQSVIGGLQWQDRQAPDREPAAEA